MLNKVSLLLTLPLLALFTSCAGLTTAYDTRTGGTSLPTVQAAKDDPSPVEKWVRALRSENQSERENAKQALITFSNQSTESRQVVIKELLKIATALNGSPQMLLESERFLEWKEAADILGTIKAREAIDVLAECLTCNNGTAGLSLGRYPAAEAIIKIGDEAIPKLAEVLEQKSEGRRLMAAEVLYELGGDKTKEILKKAAQKERDKRISTVIEQMLQDWEGSGKRRT